jgi:hypothetical protein
MSKAKTLAGTVSTGGPLADGEIGVSDVTGLQTALDGKAPGTAASASVGSELKLFEGTDNGTNFVALKAPNSLAGNVTWTLPTADGTNLQVLSTNGSGALSWTAAGGGGTPAGSDTQIQFNNSGAFGGATTLTFNKSTTTPTLGLGGVSGVTSAQFQVRAPSATNGPWVGLNTTNDGAGVFWTWDGNSVPLRFVGGGVEAMRIVPNSNILLVGKTGASASDVGCELRPTGLGTFTNAGDTCLIVNRTVNDGELVAFWQASLQEGNISVSGTTVSYNGGHLSRWAQTTNPKDDALLKGTVLSNLDEMNVYNDADGNPVANEQLNKVKVSDVEGDVNVAGVFVNWTHDDAHDVDEINMAMTGDMIIRITQGVAVQRGDLLMSAGDGTAKPQGDDIVRSKTIAKVTSTHVTCTYADGSFCVPCVLMAC